jgi:hypothetical protein
VAWAPTRFNKLARNFLAAVALASTRLLMRAYGRYGFR